MYPFANTDMLAYPRVPHGLGGHFYGVYPALVVDIVDPDDQGRVKVQLPWSPDSGGDAYAVWARLATMMAGNNRGSWYIPDVDDEVLIAFEGGNPRRPYVVGMLWNGQDTPPESMDSAGRNVLKVIRSRNGVKITLDDTDGAERMTIETPGGQVVTLEDGPRMIELRDSNGNTITMEPAGITISTPAKLTIQAAQVEMTTLTKTVDCPMTQYSGVVKVATLISNAVISSSYTPGAGNLL